MKNCFYKTYNFTFLYKKSELNNLMYKLFYRELKLKIFFNYKFFFKNFCLETGVKRSVCNFFSLYRMNLKISLNSGLINGLRKVS